MAPFTQNKHGPKQTTSQDGNSVWRPKSKKVTSSSFKNSQKFSRVQGSTKPHSPYNKKENSNKNAVPNSKQVSKQLNTRAICARIANSVFDANQNLTEALRKNTNSLSAQDNALVAEILYGVMRHRLRLEFIIDKLLSRPLKKDLEILKDLLLIGIYQLEYTVIPAYAAINETVSATEDLGFTKYKALVNAVLHNYIRQKEEILPLADKSYESAWSCPQWLILELKSHYKERLPQIFEAMNSHPPMWIRVNKLKYTCSEYQSLLREQGITSEPSSEVPYALKLSTPVPVSKLPRFNDGAVFVQDAAAQYASILLDAQDNDIVLDCCCAPGGKTTHIRELYPKIADLVAIDSQEDRLKRVHENLLRMHQEAKVVCFDAGAPAKMWSPYPQYDRILLDAPCSATGVIRRHPDIKWLRTPEDVAEIIDLQRHILENMWSMLKPGGTLVYATCSIMYGENTGQIKAFLATHCDAILKPVTPDETPENPGKQRLPGDGDMDGFYYARIVKKA